MLMKIGQVSNAFLEEPKSIPVGADPRVRPRHMSEMLCRSDPERSEGEESRYLAATFFT